MNTKQTDCPKYLGDAGCRVWHAFLAERVLDAGGLEVLGSACKLADRLAECRVELSRSTLVVQDRFGQETLHPAAGLEQQLTGQFARIMATLRKTSSPIPVDDRDDFFGSAGGLLD